MVKLRDGWLGRGMGDKIEGWVARKRYWWLN